MAPQPATNIDDDTEELTLEEIQQQIAEDENLIMPEDSEETIKAVFQSITNTIRMEGKRAALNSDISAERAGLKARGFSSEVFNLLKKVQQLEPTQRLVFDVAYRIGRKALKKPIDNQADLFKPTLVK